MGFESFLRREERRPRRHRQLSFALAAILHGTLIVAGIVYSSWHVEELTPPRLRVAFVAAAPRLPSTTQPDNAGGGRATSLPPSAGHRSTKKVTSKNVFLPALPPAPPPERPMPAKEQSQEEETTNGEADKANAIANVIDGQDPGEGEGVNEGSGKGHSVSGARDGTSVGSGTPEGPRLVSALVGGLQKQSGNMPPFESSLLHDKITYVVETRICVSRTGSVDSVTITRRSDTMLDDSVLNTVKTWRYRPMTVNKTPVPFCYPVRFEFRSES